MFNEEKYKIKRDDFIIHSLYIRPPSDIDNYPYYLSLLSDKRNFWSILKKSLKERMILLRMLCVQSQFEIRGFNFALYLTHIGLIFIFNAVFYNESLINKKLNIKDFVLKSFYVYVLELLVFKIVFKLSRFDLFEVIINEVRGIKIENFVYKNVERAKKKIMYTYFLVFIFMLYLLYYLTIFCKIFRNVQVSWFIGGWVSLLISFAINVLSSVLFALMKRIAIENKCKCLYNILLYVKLKY